MNWKEIRRSGEIFEHLPEIWRREQELPLWFRNSSSVWTPALPEMASFVDECQAVFALFNDAGHLTACVYVEKQREAHAMTIHLSIIERMKPSIFVAEAAKLRDALFHQGIKSIRGWCLRKNFALGQILAAIGFKPTEFVLDHGESHGRVMRWSLVEIRSA
jgi:hypothetical protein